MKRSLQQEINSTFASEQPVNVSRRRFLLSSAGLTAGAFVLGVALPAGKARADGQNMPAGTRVPAFLEIGADNKVRLQSPFNEGGQGVFTAMAQLVGEELDADPATFEVVNAPTGADYKVMTSGPGRITGGSMSVRFSYPVMRRLGGLARQMLLAAGAAAMSVPIAELSTKTGRVIHAASGRSLTYGELAEQALDLPVPDPDSIKLKDESEFSWIGKPVHRLDVYDKSVGKAQYSIDMKVDGMMHAAVQHAPRLGLEVGSIRNREQIENLKGVHSLHILPGAVAVVAEHWWDAKRAVEGVLVDWVKPDKIADGARYMPEDFSTEAFNDQLAARTESGTDAETKGDAKGVLDNSDNVISATYRTQYVNHGQLEPPSALARFNEDGSLDVWMPNQAPDMFQADISKRTGLAPEKINVHSPILGGFFGRHFLYNTGNPYPQAIELAKRVKRPVKLIWSREEEFLRDPLRPMAAAKMRAVVGDDGLPKALEVISSCEGPTEGIQGKHNPDKLDPTALEGLTGKAYNIPNVRIAQDFVENPTMLAYWRSVGNSMNDFLYETFLDEIADNAKTDPVEMRLKLLEGNERLTTLLNEVVDLSGGWKRGPFKAEDGSMRARGVGMASPFGSQAAAIAEVSIENGKVRVHHVWEAIDPGKVVNPSIVEHQVRSAVALGLSQVLKEEAVYEKGERTSRNYDMYPILRLSEMPEVHVRAVESGAKMGGIGEPGLPAVPPAVVNAVSQLVGRRIRRMPLSRESFEEQA